MAHPTLSSKWFPACHRGNSACRVTRGTHAVRPVPQATRARCRSTASLDRLGTPSNAEGPVEALTTKPVPGAGLPPARSRVSTVYCPAPNPEMCMVPPEFPPHLSRSCASCFRTYVPYYCLAHQTLFLLRSGARQDGLRTPHRHLGVVDDPPLSAGPGRTGGAVAKYLNSAGQS
jgi:hypothetical protein